MLSSKKLYFYHFICKFIPATRCHQLKINLLRWCGAKIGEDVEITSTAKFYGGYNLVIGNHCYIGHEALIFGANQSNITIEDYAKIGSRVIVVTGSHVFTPDGPCIEGKGIYNDIKICRGAVVSTGSIILPGKTIGEMSHVAAGSVVTHDVPSYHRDAGVPARVIKNFKEQQ